MISISETVKLPLGNLISPEIIEAVLAEAIWAHSKHGEQSMLGSDKTDFQRLSILVEEVGEVAKPVNDFYDPESAIIIQEELIQVAAVALTWLQAIKLRNQS